MNKKISVIAICMILLLAIMPLIIAVPPVQTTIAEQSLTIAYPQYQYIKINSNFTLYIHVQNSSQYLTGSQASCFLGLYNSSGNEICHSRLIEGVTDYYLPIYNNFTSLGDYSFVIQCNTTTQTGLANGIFEVTNSGIELTQGRAYIDIGLLALLIIFLIISIYIFVSFDNLLVRVGMLGLIYLLLIAITFIAWNMAVDFLISAPFVAKIFRILFLTLMIGALPLLIGAFVWYFLMLWKIKEIQRLMDKGFSFEESKRRIK